MEFVENDRLNAAQRRVLNQLPQQNPLSLKLDARGIAHAIFEADLIADFAAKLDPQLLCDARGEQPRRQTARLKNHDLPAAEQPVLEQHLRDLGGFAGTGRRLQNEPLRRLERGNDVVLNLVNGQSLGHEISVKPEPSRAGFQNPNPWPALCVAIFVQPECRSSPHCRCKGIFPRDEA